MKNISTRFIIALFSVQLTLVYVLLGMDTLSRTYPAFVFAIIPVVVILGLGIWQLDVLWQKYEHDVLYLKIQTTAKNLWFWILLLFSSLLILGIIYWTGQLLLPEADISQDFTFNDSAYQGLVLLIIVCSVFYIASIIWIKKTLKNIWDC